AQGRGEEGEARAAQGRSEKGQARGEDKESTGKAEGVRRKSACAPSAAPRYARPPAITSTPQTRRHREESELTGGLLLIPPPRDGPCRRFGRGSGPGRRR